MKRVERSHQWRFFTKVVSYCSGGILQRFLFRFYFFNFLFYWTSRENEKLHFLFFVTKTSCCHHQKLNFDRVFVNGTKLGIIRHTIVIETELILTRLQVGNSDKQVFTSYSFWFIHINHLITSSANLDHDFSFIAINFQTHSEKGGYLWKMGLICLSNTIVGTLFWQCENC